MIEDIVLVNGEKYITYRMLGKGKGGYSYLAKRLGLPEGEIVFKSFDTQKEEHIDESRLTVSLLTDSFPSGYMFDGFDIVPMGYVLLKKIHHEPCDYYSFGNKIEAVILTYDDKDGGKAKVVINARPKDFHISFGEEWYLIADESEAGATPIKAESAATVRAISMRVYVNKILADSLK